MKIKLPYTQLIVLIDSSGKGKKEQIGPCLAFWVAYLYEPFDKKSISSTALKIEEEIRYEVDILREKEKNKPIRCGMIFSDKRGPNIIFYEGIIDALESCKYLMNYAWDLRVIMTGDCKRVIDEIKNNKSTGDIQGKLLKQIKNLEKEYKKKKVDIEYRWTPREEFLTYKKIDQLAKSIQEKIIGQFQFKKGKGRKKKKSSRA